MVGGNGWSIHDLLVTMRSSLSIYPLNPTILLLLWEEVASYWRDKDMGLTNSVFTIKRKIMAKHDDWIDERLPALATMFLTRREDLSLKRGDRAESIDMVVGILAHDGDGREPGRRTFGVELRGAMSPVTIVRANKTLGAVLHRRVQPAKVPYPVCLLFFTMEDDAGYYTWVLEPLIRDGLAKLRRRHEADCQQFDRAGLDEVVCKVNEWYDVFYSTALV